MKEKMFVNRSLNNRIKNNNKFKSLIVINLYLFIFIVIIIFNCFQICESNNSFVIYDDDVYASTNKFSNYDTSGSGSSRSSKEILLVINNDAINLNNFKYINLNKFIKFNRNQHHQQQQQNIDNKQEHDIHELINYYLNDYIIISKSLYTNMNNSCMYSDCNLFESWKKSTNLTKTKNNLSINYINNVRLLSYHINSSTNIYEIINLFNIFNMTYSKNMLIKNNSCKSIIECKTTRKYLIDLKYILIISKTNQISILTNIFKYFQVPIYTIDLQKAFHYSPLSIQLEDVNNQQANKHQIYSLNPSIHQTIKAIESFNYHKRFEKTNIYVLEKTEEDYIRYKKHKNNLPINKIKNVKHLLKTLISLNKMMMNNMRNTDISKKVIKFSKTSSSYNYHFINEIDSFIRSNELIVINCDFKLLFQILRNFKHILDNYEKYFDNKIFEKYYNYKRIKIKVLTILWLPENDDRTMFNIDDNELKLMLLEFSKFSYMFEVYKVNWIVDLDKIVDNFISIVNNEQDISKCLSSDVDEHMNENSSSEIDCIFNKAKESGKFSIERFYTYFISFKLMNQTLHEIDPDHINSSEIISNDVNQYIPFKFTFVQNHIKNEINYQRNDNNFKFKPKYRVVTVDLEPFTIVSGPIYDDGLDSVCTDGVLCLDIKLDKDVHTESHDKQNLENELNSVFNKNNFIKLISDYSFHNHKKNVFEPLNETNSIRKCCSGYVVNLLDKLSKDLNFDFELYLAADHQFGHYDKKTKSWSGAMNDIVNGVSHIVAGPFSITEERAKFIDFTHMFLYSGYSLLIKEGKPSSYDVFMFMKPFTNLHWALIIIFGFLSASSLALLEFNSPFGLNPNGRQRARNYTLGSAISMVISLMFMHTMPAKSPKSWAGKWTQNFIAGFALFFIATYTAQMASILSQTHDNKAYKGFEDEELLTLKRGFLESSGIEHYLCKNEKAIYKSHCKEAIIIESETEGIKAINNRTIDVFMSELEIINYYRFLQHDCGLKLTGKPYATTGYAFGIQKSLKSKLTDKMNLKVLEYYESGYLDELYQKWFNKRNKCNKKPQEERISIDIYQYKGVYAYLGLGLVAAIFVLAIEQALYKWTIPWLRKKPKKSQWKDLKLMFFSQRIYRIVHSEKVYDATQSAKDFINVIRTRDFEAIFQKSFRKKQMESMQGSQLRKRPKLWALIEASTERHSRDLINISQAQNFDADNVEMSLVKKIPSKNKNIKIPLLDLDVSKIKSLKKRKQSKERNGSLPAANDILLKESYTTNSLSQTLGYESTELDAEFINENSDFTPDVDTPALEKPELSYIEDSDIAVTPKMDHRKQLTNLSTSNDTKSLETEIPSTSNMQQISINSNHNNKKCNSEDSTDSSTSYLANLTEIYEVLSKFDNLNQQNYKTIFCNYINNLKNELDRLKLEKKVLENELKLARKNVKKY